MGLGRFINLGQIKSLGRKTEEEISVCILDSWSIKLGIVSLCTSVEWRKGYFFFFLRRKSLLNVISMSSSIVKSVQGDYHVNYFEFWKCYSCWFCDCHCFGWVCVNCSILLFVCVRETERETEWAGVYAILGNE